MKYLFTSAYLLSFWMIFSQVIAPKASPSSRLEQRVGLTDITITYSRPSVNGRIIFGDLVPYNEYWRLGANESTKLTCTDILIFGKDTLKAGTYAVYAKPSATEWQVAFYTEYGNWGMPQKWDESKVAFTVKTPVINVHDKVENLTIDINNMDNDGGDIVIAWDKVKIQIPFSVSVKEKVLASIKKVMSGPTANDYHTAAKYYLEEKIDDKQALEWVEKAITMRPEAYWMLRTKSLIQASLGKYNEAISTAEQCIKLAEADGDTAYVSQCKNSIADWKKRK
jgi:tetratricopeptide (TPR) repeat protein